MASCILRCILEDCPWGDVVHGGMLSMGGCCQWGGGGGDAVTWGDAVHEGILFMGGSCSWGDLVHGGILSIYSF